jgi:hypothetical protein
VNLPVTAGVNITQTTGGTVTAYPAPGVRNVGDKVTFTATHSAGYVQTAWNDACRHAPAGQTCQLTITGATTVSATFTDTSQPLPVTVTRLPSAGGTIAANPAGPYAVGDTVVFTANPLPLLVHTSWGGACSHVLPDLPCELTLTADATVLANFAVAPAEGAKATVDRVPSPVEGGSITADPTAPEGGYDAGTIVTFTAAPAAGYVQLAWGDVCSHVPAGQTCHLRLTADATVSATFSNTPVTVLLTYHPDAAAGTIAASPAGPHYVGQAVTFTATPATGYRHTGWGGSCSSASANQPCQVTLAADTTVRADFALATVTVTVQTPLGGGAVTPVTGTFTYGTEVTFTAAPTASYVHTAWGHACSHIPTGMPCALTLTRDVTVSAAFTSLSFTKVKTNELGSFTQSYDYPTPGGLYYTKLSGSYEDPEENTKSCEFGISWRVQRVR